MKLTFELVYGPNINIFNAMVNKRLTEGYRFMQGSNVAITEMPGKPGHQYSVAMILEEGEE